ncbi:MAG: DUF4430 domain-containing protein [Phycisphaerales bacterium]|nr:DUF4430 domain-containing protein [Phycisphaerales bacterium]
MRKPLPTNRWALLGAALIGVPALLATAPADDAEAQAQHATVALTIDFANGFEMRYTLPEMQDGATALDVMLAARAHECPLQFEYKGEGPKAFLMSIEGVSNELKGPGSTNWLYWVNDGFAKVGMGQQVVHDGDEITWRFGRMKDATNE